MTMTRRDFQEVAAAVAATKADLAYDPDATAQDALAAVTRQLAAACARRYRGGYGFNRPRFLDACGYPEA